MNSIRRNVSQGVIVLSLWLLVLGVATADSPQPNQPLLAQSRQLATLHNVSDDTYFWTSDHEVILLRHVPRPFVLSPSMKKAMGAHRFSFPNDYAPGYYQLLHLDTNTSRVTLLTPFNGKWSKSITSMPMIVTPGNDGQPSSTYYHPPACAPSPDGQWLVWLHENKTWIAARLDGSRRLQWPSASHYGGECAWLPDGKHWVELAQTYQDNAYRFTQATIYSITDPASSRRVILNTVADGIMEGVLSNGSLLVVDPGLQMSARVRLTHFSLVGQSARPVTSQVHLPQSGEVFGTTVSPARDRLAWMILSDDHERYALWISDTEGTHWRGIGTDKEGVLKDGKGSRFYWPQAVQWTPGGKQLSFMFKDALWVVTPRQAL